MPRFVIFFSVLCLRFKKHKNSGLMPQFVFIIICYYVFAFRFQKHKSCGLIPQVGVFLFCLCFGLGGFAYLSSFDNLGACLYVSLC